MKRLITAVLISAFVALGLSAPATAAVRVPGTDRSCTNECVQEKFQQIATNGHSAEGGAEWTQNTGLFLERGHIRCKNTGTGTATTRNGGWVTALFKYSFAYCNTGEVAIHVAWQWKACSTCAVTTVWFYPATKTQT